MQKRRTQSGKMPPVPPFIRVVKSGFEAMKQLLSGTVLFLMTGFLVAQTTPKVSDPHRNMPDVQQQTTATQPQIPATPTNLRHGATAPPQPVSQPQSLPQQTPVQRSVQQPTPAPAQSAPPAVQNY